MTAIDVGAPARPARAGFAGHPGRTGGAAVVLAVLGCWTAAAPAARAASAPWFGLADLRQGQASVLWSSAPAPGALSYVVLAPADDKPRLSCCLKPQGRAKPDTDSGTALLHTDAPALRRQALRRAQGATQPQVALAITGRHAQVDKLAPQTLLIRWAGRDQQLKVQSCTSSEGMHVRVTPQGAAAAPAQHFYLPLGMDVEADCPAEMLAPPARQPDSPIARQPDSPITR